MHNPRTFLVDTGGAIYHAANASTESHRLSINKNAKSLTWRFCWYPRLRLLQRCTLYHNI